MGNIWHVIRRWPGMVAWVFAREWRLVLHDPGALLFFLFLPLAYPVIYTLIYNPEVVRDLPVAVVDDDRTAVSRALVREADASPAINVYDYAANLGEARRMMARGDVFAILEIPRGYARKIGRMETAHATLYCEMSLLLRYRTLMSAASEIQLRDIQEITAQRRDMLGAAGSVIQGMPVDNQAHMLGDNEQGFASFIMPGIVILVLQQSMLLGISLLGGTSRERRRRNGGIDPLMVPGAGPAAVVCGRTLCYVTFYIAPTIFLLHYIPEIFALPHAGDPVQYLLLALPLLLASAFMGQTINLFSKDRESSFIVVVFTSVVFLFLSGLTWPRYAMPALWQWIGDAIPATWGIEGFIRINSNAGTLAENAHAYHWLWLLTAAYAVTAYAVLRIITRTDRRHTPKN